MSGALNTPKSSAFLAFPPEIRLQIFEFCIPQNLSIDSSFGDIYTQCRPKGWKYPPWRIGMTRERDAHDGTYYSSKVRDDCPNCNSKAACAVTTGAGKGDEKGEHGFARLNYEEKGGSKSSCDENDGPDRSVTDDWCFTCRRYRPEVPSSRRSALPGVLLVCRQITDEAETMLYGGNTFEFSVNIRGQEDHLAKFYTGRLEKMRKIILFLQPMQPSFSAAFRMDPAAWDALLSNLSTLEVIADQPRPRSPSELEWYQGEEDDELEWGEDVGESDDIPHLDEDMKEADLLEHWAGWLTPTLDYLGQVVSDRTRIRVDANDKEFTVQIFEKAMPGRCQFQQLGAADFLFRSDGSLPPPESAYWDDDGPTS